MCLVLRTLLLGLILAPLWVGAQELRPLVPGPAWRPAKSPTVLQYRVLKLIERAKSRFPPGRSEPVFAPTCVKAPTISDFFDLKDLQSRDLAQATSPLPDLNRPTTHINDVFHLLRSTRWGAAVMKKFFPRFGFDTRIEHFTEAMKNEERQRGRRAAAVYDADKKTIYVNKSEAIGTVAPILLHEIVHSLDNDFARSIERERKIWSDFDASVNALLRKVSVRTGKAGDDVQESDLTTEEMKGLAKMKWASDQFRDIRVFRAERVAYDIYFNVLTELAKRFPLFYQPTRHGGIRPYDDAEVIAAEGLNPETIAKFQAGLCVTRPSLAQ